MPEKVDPTDRMIRPSPAFYCAGRGRLPDVLSALPESVTNFYFCADSARKHPVLFLCNTRELTGGASKYFSQFLCKKYYFHRCVQL